MIRRLSTVSSLVVNSSISSTVPRCPAITTVSPTRKGLNKSSITPAAMCDKDPCSASPIANPAVPSTATKLVAGTPNMSRHAMTTIASSPHRARFDKNFASVMSTCALVSPRTVMRTSQLDMTNAATRNTNAPTTRRPYCVSSSLPLLAMFSQLNAGGGLITVPAPAGWPVG